MFGAKYSRLKFWIISIFLLIPFIISNSFSRALDNSENNQNGLFFFSIVFYIVIILWINTLANRIRDFGSSPWYSLFAFIPLVNIVMAFYFGIVKNNNPRVNDGIKEVYK